jgi:hypothetical protein
MRTRRHLPLAALLAAAAALPAPMRAAPSRGAAAAVAPLAPGQAACPQRGGLPRRQIDASGYGSASAPGAPLLVAGVGDVLAVAYLAAVRRPVPHVAAVAAVGADGRPLWRVPLPSAGQPTALAAVGGALALALLAPGGGVDVQVRSAATGRLLAQRLLAWPGRPPAPSLTTDGTGGLLIATPAVDLPAALSGLGVGPSPMWDLGPDLRVRWRAAAVGDPVAVGDGAVVAAYRAGAAGRVLALTALAAVDGGVRWRLRLALPRAPSTAAFSLSAGVLAWDATWPGGGEEGAVSLADGRTLWRRPTAATLLAAGQGRVAAGGAPWSPPAPVAVRALGSGRAVGLRDAGDGLPVLWLAGGLLTLSPAGEGTSWRWVGAAGAAVRAGAPLPPVYAYCAPGGVYLLSPWQAAALWWIPPTR